MATTTRGRMSAGSRSGSGWYGTGATYKQSTATQTKGSAGKRPVKGYEATYNGFNNKISSFKMLYSQTWGSAKHTRPSTTVLNSFANWINKGAVIQTVSCAQVAKWARATTKVNFSTRSPSANACKNVLWNKFGKTTIKAVARTKTGSFMVATTPTLKGKPFCFPC